MERINTTLTGVLNEIPGNIEEHQGGGRKKYKNPRIQEKADKHFGLKKDPEPKITSSKKQKTSKPQKKDKKDSAFEGLENFDTKNQYVEVRLKSCESYLAHCGHKWPENYKRNHRSPNIKYYYAPWRDESEPSLKVDISRNEWYDFGEGVGGGIIKLVMKLEKLEAGQAIEYLKGESFSHVPFVNKKKGEPDVFIIVKISDFKGSFPLMNYLSNRGISRKVAGQYVKKVEYFINGKGQQDKSKDPLYALGMETLAGSWELNNKIRGSEYKTIIGKKHLTIIKGRLPDSPQLNTFENSFDFMSAIEYERYLKKNTGITMLKYDTVITHGVHQIGLIPKFINLDDYEQINSLFHNDTAGLNACNKLSEMHPKVVNQSIKVHPVHKDFNQFWVEGILHGFCNYKEHTLPYCKVKSNFKMLVQWKEFIKNPKVGYSYPFYSKDTYEERKSPPKKGLTLQQGLSEYGGLREMVKFGYELLRSGKAKAINIYLNKVVNDLDPLKRLGYELIGGDLHKQYKLAQPAA